MVVDEIQKGMLINKLYKTFLALYSSEMFFVKLVLRVQDFSSDFIAQALGIANTSIWYILKKKETTVVQTTRLHPSLPR